MRILWVKVGGLWPLNTGGRLRTAHIVKGLSRRHRVTLYTSHGPAEDEAGLRRELADCAEIVSIPYAGAKRGSPRFVAELVRSWLSPMPVDVSKWRIPELARRVAEHLRAGEADVCVADFLTAVPNVPMDGPVPVVLFEHNVEYMIWKRLRDEASSPLARALLEIEWRKMRRFEHRSCARAALTVAVSDVDRDMLAAGSPGATIRDIATGVDVDYFGPDGVPERPGSIVFTGAMDWYPNEDAMLHFVEATLPSVRAAVPGATMTIVGRNPSERLRAAAAAAGARVTGTVDDVRPYVAEAAVYVVPLRIGGGTRLKIFEALAMRKAVVSTAIGAEGLPILSGEHFIEANEPAAFAAAVVALLGDAERRRRLGATARELIESRYTWTHVAREFEAMCEEGITVRAR